MTARTHEAQKALESLQAALRPGVGAFLDEVCVELAGRPQDEIDDELRRIGHTLFQLMKHQTGQDLSEALQIGLPFAFIEMARERLAQMPTGREGGRH